mmetsp:Transcript_27135/g.68445  ORF Transcript_27135/g.68445 Transcript_27135/m.68445 type:complete len:82 (+) Transcript_27135:217-462(+)
MAKIASKMVVCGLVGLTDALQVNVATTTHERVPNPINWVRGKFARKTETDESAAARACEAGGRGGRRNSEWGRGRGCESKQ